MNNVKDDSYYIEKAIESVDCIIEYTKNVSDDCLKNANALTDAILFRLVQVAENVKMLSDEFKQTHKDMDLGLTIGFRNGIVHKYGNTDYSIVCEIVRNDITKLKMQLEKVKNK